MDKRTAESPMDFEWQTRAPGDVTSPFYQLSMQHDNQKKRPHSIFDSPEKKSMPALREPNSQPFLFSQPKPQQPPSTPKPFFNQSAFMTPRKFDVDFSSGAENMSSPEHADNEDTPEQPKAHRNSLFSMYGRFAPSPGRGEIPRVSHYSNALARRVQKRRRRDKALDLQLRRDSDDESDRPSSSELKPTKQRQKPGQGQQEATQTGSRLTSFSDFFALLEAHPNVPSILSWWAQLVVNLSLFSLAVYVVFGFVSAIRAEFEQAAEEVSDTILAEMAACAKSYVDNRCAGGDRLPALESVCENWERCMNRDPAKVGRAKVSAHTMAVIINSFIDPISWKAIMFFLATISTVTVVSNWSFRSFRNRLNQHDYSAPPSYSRQSSGQHPSLAPSQFPYQQNSMGYMGAPNHGATGFDKAEAPLMLEQAATKDFVSERTRERGSRLRTPSPSKRMRMTKRNLIVVSNRLPLSLKKVDGGYESSLSSGGLVTSLSGLTKTTTFSWFGWPGIDITDETEQGQIRQSLDEHNAVPIFLDNELANNHYNNFSNAILWPILHYQSGINFEEGPWEAYQRVNEIFADTIAEAAQPGSLIWVHDYHLMLLPRLLRDRLAGKNCAIGFSLHTPFPAGDFWRNLPVQKDLLRGLLASDVIGFHTDEYKRNFVLCAESLADAKVKESGALEYEGHEVVAEKFIVGIDPQKFTDALQNEEVQNRIRELQRRYMGMKVIVGVDRLDYIKGLVQKLKGYDAFLDQYPELSNKVVLIQVAVPSREDVKEYQDLETELSTLAGRINGKHSTADGCPLIYMHRSVNFSELTALYSVADACLLTSTRDGMNLVSFEYVACQAQRHGVLVLSEFAGAASFMKEGCLTFHPANMSEMVDAVHQAVTMSGDDRKSRYETLRHFIETNTSAKWGETFIETLTKHVEGGR
ncbi:alpha,alpha-trehalose-phosphate synthase subunit [Aspergillus niger]|nr:alpha,alpha-trehalose-phosphate synthase subunit [Aspergillus niger]